MGLHEWGDERDVFRREDLTTLNVGIRKPAALPSAPSSSTGVGAGGSSAGGASSAARLGKGKSDVDCNSPPSFLSRFSCAPLPDTVFFSSSAANTALPRTASWASRPGAATPTPQPSGLASLPPNPTLTPAAPPPGTSSLGANRPLSSTVKTKIPGQLGALAPSEPRMVTVKLSTGKGVVKEKERVVVSLAAGGSTDKDAKSNGTSTPPPGLAQVVKEKKKDEDKVAKSSSPSTPLKDASTAPATTSKAPEPEPQTPTPSPSPPPSQPSSLQAPAAAAAAPIVGTAPPPGLSLPPTRASTPQPPAPSTAEDEPYHPSTATQALLSDVTNNRPEPSSSSASDQQQAQQATTFGGLSAFGQALPDFGKMLDFDDGFAFQMRVVADDKRRPPNGPYAGVHDGPSVPPLPHQPLVNGASTFSPFGFGLPSALGGILGAPASASPYVGSFDPFGDATPSLGQGQGQGGQENDDPHGSRRSRFEFARKNSKPASPRGFNNGGLALPPFGGNDPMSSSRRGSQDLAFGGGFAWNMMAEGAPRGSGTNSPALGRQQPQQQQQQQQHVSQHAPPPPGLSPLPSSASLLSQRQQQQANAFAQGLPPNLPVNKLQQQYPQHQQQHQQQQGNNWIHQLTPRPGSGMGNNDRMAFARQQQQQSQSQQQQQSQTLKDMLGVGLGAYGGGPSNGNGGAYWPSVPSLFSFVLTSRCLPASPSTDYGFQDPAIMSMRHPNQQRQQQQQQQQQLQAFGGANGPHSPFSPLGSGANGAFTPDLHASEQQQSLSGFPFSNQGQQQDGRNARLMPSQQGYFGGLGQQQGRTPSPANLGGLASGRHSDYLRGGVL